MNSPQSPSSPPQPLSPRQQRATPRLIPHAYCRVCATLFPAQAPVCPTCKIPPGLRANPDDPTMTTFLP